MGALREAHHLQRLFGTLASLACTHARYEHRQLYVLYSREDRKQVIELEYEAHLLGAQGRLLAIVHRVEGSTVDQNLPGVGRVEPRKAVEEGCLAAARWTHHSGHLATPHTERYPPQSVHLDGARIVGLVNVFSLDYIVETLRRRGYSRVNPICSSIYHAYFLLISDQTTLL
jgi:hypothetical protein